VVAGKVTVVYADPNAKQIGAATLNGTTWTKGVVANGTVGFGLSFAAAGDSAYVASYNGNGKVEESTWSKGAWETHTVADAENPDFTATGHDAANTAVAATADGTVYVAWETPDGVALASGSGAFDAVDVGTTVNNGADPALATSDNAVALAWYDRTAQNQMIGFLGDLTDVVVARPSPSLVPSVATGGGECGGKKTILDETAQGTAFQQTCLVAPADQPFAINFDNQDAGLQHNIHIFADSSATDSIFMGDLLTGVDQTTYNIKQPLKAGEYFFHCDVHIQMTGTLAVVKGAK
jgi:plastocyanin